MTIGDPADVSSPAVDEPEGRRMALVIATSAYNDQTLASLRAPGNDAKELAQVLADTRIGQFDVATVLDEPVDALRHRIAEFCIQGEPLDLALVYLSCHGVLDDHGRLYYATVDTDHNKLSVTALPATWLNEQLEDCPCRQQILVLDCCHSGAFTKGSKGERPLALRNRFGARGRVVLTASRATEYSFEAARVMGEGASSVFTGALVRGLRTGDADSDRNGLITVTELYDYASREVKASDPRQNPGLWSFASEGNLLVAQSPRGAIVEPKPLPEDLVIAFESPRSKIREGAVAELAQILVDADAGRALTARDQLIRMADQDNPSVSSAAQSVLDAHPEATTPSAPAFGPRPSARPHSSTPSGESPLTRWQLTRVLDDHTGWVSSVGFSPDGRTLASAGEEPSVRLWDIASGVQSASLEGHTDSVLGVDFSRATPVLASACQDGLVRLWDANGAGHPRPLEGHSDWVRAVAFSPDGRVLASASHDGSVRLWYPAFGALAGTLEGHTGWVAAVAFSPDGRLVASAGYDGTVRMWDASSGTLTATLDGHIGGACALAFTPNGQVLATGAGDGLIRMWDIDAGTLTSTLKGHVGGLHGLAFHADGRLLASSGGDGLIRLWDVVTATRMATLEGHTNVVLAVAFAPDGCVLASAGLDSTVCLWGISR